MSNGVSVKISSHYDGKGVKQAQSSIQALTKTARTLNLAISGLVIGKVFQGINKVLDGSVDEFKKNNIAQSQLFKSLQNNTKTAKEDIRGFVKEIDSMGKYFGGNELVSGANYLANLGLDKEQITSTLQAARDLSASGIMPLNTAVEQLGKSWNGNVASLKKLYPELGSLTQEELKNGEAVKQLQERYKGFENQLSNTFDGMDKQYATSVGNLRQKIGESLTTTKGGGLNVNRSKRIKPCG